MPRAARAALSGSTSRATAAARRAASPPRIGAGPAQVQLTRRRRVRGPQLHAGVAQGQVLQQVLVAGRVDQVGGDGRVELQVGKDRRPSPPAPASGPWRRGPTRRPRRRRAGSAGRPARRRRRAAASPIQTTSTGTGRRAGSGAKASPQSAERPSRPSHAAGHGEGHAAGLPVGRGARRPRRRRPSSSTATSRAAPAGASAGLAFSPSPVASRNRSQRVAELEEVEQPAQLLECPTRRGRPRRGRPRPGRRGRAGWRRRWPRTWASASARLWRSFGDSSSRWA